MKSQISWTAGYGTVKCAILVTLRVIIIHQTHYEKSDWSRAFNQFIIACQLDMINVLSAADITFYHGKFIVCLVTKPLGVFSSETKWRNASDELCEKCIIKQLLNSVFAWYHELSNPHVCVNIISVITHNKQLLDEVEHDIMNYQSRGLCYLPKPKAVTDWNLSF